MNKTTDCICVYMRVKFFICLKSILWQSGIELCQKLFFANTHLLGKFKMHWVLGVNRCRPAFGMDQQVRSCCVALGTVSGHLWRSMIMWEKRMYTCMCNWVTMLYSGKLTEHCKFKKKKKRCIGTSKLALPWVSFFLFVKWDNKRKQ